MTTKLDTMEQNIFNQVRLLREKGLSTDEAIGEIESILRAKLPEGIKDRIKTEMNFEEFRLPVTTSRNQLSSSYPFL